MSFSKIAVVGLGYIGLPTAAVIASRGVDVIGIETNKTTVDTVNAGKIHIVEPDLDIVVQSVVTMGKLRAVLEPEPADAFIIAVPTPLTEDNKPDISYVESASRTLATVLESGNLVILESTSPVGTTERVADILKEERPDLSFPQDAGDAADIKIAHCPERVLPGYVLQELVANDRLVGGLSNACSERAVELYSLFIRGDCLITNARTAELAKLTENSFRDVNIAFANELSLISDELDIDVWELIELANLHPRVNILNPGPGVGGHCIAVDPWFVIDSAPEQSKLIKQARLLNDYKPDYVVEQIAKAAAPFKEPVIACLGLAFKANIDDLRESPALTIVAKLSDQKVGRVLAVEPNITREQDKPVLPDVELVNLQQALDEAHIVVVLVDHKEFKDMPQRLLNTKIVIDTRGITNTRERRSHKS